MVEQCPLPLRDCPFDRETQERIAVLETEARVMQKNLEQMADDMRAIRKGFEGLTTKLAEAIAAARAGWWVLSSIGAIAMVFGSLVTWLLTRLPLAGFLRP